MRILGVDTSCDDTGVGLVVEGRVVANLRASQEALHAPFGGVVPELASREHLRWLDRLVAEALAQGGLALEDLDLLAVTRGPGLVGPLLVGLNYVKALAWSLDKPYLAIHHLEGHLASAWVGLKEEPPFLALIASGGHTHLFEVSAWGDYRLLGATRDDAVGEAFDKAARLLGLGYPGGPLLEALAREGDPHAVSFPLPLKGQKGYDFSFSGLKTALVQRLEQGFAREDLAASFQEAALRHLVQVVRRAARDLGHTTVLIVGGVAQNARLQALCEGLKVYFPLPGLATDNGAMIALAAWLRWQGKGDPLELPASPYLPLA